MLLNRVAERATLGRLLDGARAGRSGVLMVRGVAGVGKTALLDHAIEAARGLRVARVAGIESEMELAFAGLHQLCAPMLGAPDRLPPPQRDALSVAFGMKAGELPDRFRVGLAALSLLSDVAQERPLLCVIDDAQWLDRASAQALGFVARRLLAEPVVLLVAARELGEEFGRLPELHVRGLSDDAARELLDSVIRGPMDEGVRERILAESGANPLALLELPRGLTPAELAGGFGFLDAPGLSGRIERSFLRRLEALPAAAQRLLLVAAAEPGGDPALVCRAAGRLGIGMHASAAAEADDLLMIGQRLTFRHPLIRSAVYQAASPEERRAVHQALADGTDPLTDPEPAPASAPYPGGDMVIRTPDQRLRVFVSSTLGELADERRAVSRAISALRLTPVQFEVGARPHPPRELYRAYLAQSDVFIGLYWQRYGQLGPGMEISGLEDEFELSRGLPRLLYIKAPAPDREPGLAALLSRIEREVSFRVFGTPAELARLVRDDLAMLLSERFAWPSSAADSREAPSPPAARRGPRPMPVATTSLVGREQAIGEVAALVERSEVRLVTLTGPGGIGKTRLAVAVGEQLLGRFGAGIVFVPLAAVTEPRLVLATVGRAIGADLAGASSPLEALAEQFGDQRWLLILDNLEQVADVAPDLDALLARCRALAILGTSRTVLGLRAEREYPVPPLPLPADSATLSVAELVSSPTVALFVDRARAVRPGFGLTERNAAAVAEICRRLEGLPLAIELAAARTRLLEPGALLGRLAASLDALGTGAVDMPERQRTLRATVQWSVGLLDDVERSLLEVMAAFVDGWTIESAAQVAGLDENRALELCEALTRHSLVSVDDTELGPRLRMLETIRVFVAERLAARPDLAEIQRRHAEHFRALAEQADRPLRGASHGAFLERLESEAGNLAAAVRWFLAHDRAPLPHLFRVLWPFWFLRDPMGEGRAWVGQLLPSADSLEPEARAELFWTMLVAALEVGDDAAALGAREQLEPLLAGIKDPFLHAVSQLAMAWSSPIIGDFDGALQAASASMHELCGQDELFWTALAAGSLGAVETAIGRYDDAVGHLREVRHLGDQFGSAWLAAWGQVQLGTLSILRGDLDQARAVLEEALDLSLSARSTRSMTLCLAAFARLAFARGDPDRAALLAGAAEGMRRPAGLQAWPTLRRAEAELIAQARQALGPDKFDMVFAAGSRLSRQQAVAAVRDPRSAATQPS